MNIQVIKKPASDWLYYSQQHILCTTELETLHLLPQIKVFDFLAGRYALKKLFQDSLPESAPLTDIVVTYHNQKPRIQFKNALYYCSLSHSKNFVASVFDKKSEVGIDVEELVARSPELELYIRTSLEEQFFSREDTFVTTRVWTIKEAAFKADIEQVPLSEYRIIGRKQDIYEVVNTQTGRKCEVVNTVFDTCSVSYTISSTP